jgi:hypothetical protein
MLIPLSLFWFAWTVQLHLHWIVSISSTFYYGIGQVAIFNSTQNYYIDAFEKYAASAIAAGALFWSVIGCVMQLFTPSLIDNVGVGWGVSVFSLVGVVLDPSPLLFYYFGEGLRKRVTVNLDRVQVDKQILNFETQLYIEWIASNKIGVNVCNIS